MNYSFFQEAALQATYGHLLERASCRQSDQFSSSCQEKAYYSKFGLVKCCRIFQQRSQTDFVSNRELFKFFKPKLPRAICLIERATDNLINFKQLSRKGLVSSSYSSAIEFSNSSRRKTS